MRRELRPNPGPQEIFLSTPADIAIYGGSAGSGKSFATLLDPLRHVHRPGFRAIMFRRESTRLVGSGSLWDESQSLYPLVGAQSRQAPSLEWRFPSGATIEMRHLQHAKDVHAHQGKQYAGVYFDEVTEFDESQFWYLISRMRTTIGVRPYVRATCNPDPDSFVRRLIAWWIGLDGYPNAERSGVLRWLVRSGDDLLWFDSREQARAAYPDREPLSLTFIAASLADNPLGDPTYRDRLMVLPRVERERLLGGNWDIRAAAGEVFRRTWFRAVEHVDERMVVARVRAWDIAATEPHAGNPDPDWLVGARLARLRDGRTIIEHIERARTTPAGVRQLIARTAELDGKRTMIVLPRDPGAAGKMLAQELTTALATQGYRVRVIPASRDKLTLAQPWSAAAEQGSVDVMHGAWTDAFFAEAESFPKGGHDDQIDAVSLGWQALIGAGTVSPLTSPIGGVGYEL